MGVGFLRPHTPPIVPERLFKRFPLDSIKLPVIRPGDVEDTQACSAAAQGRATCRACRYQYLAPLAKSLPHDVAYHTRFPGNLVEFASCGGKTLATFSTSVILRVMRFG